MVRIKKIQVFLKYLKYIQTITLMYYKLFITSR